jgi:xanthomonalisin
VSSTNGRKVIRNEFGATGVLMHGGAWGAWFGGAYNERTSVQQSVKIYAGTSYLAYWHYIASADYCGYDRAYVKVNGAIVDQYDLCDANDTHGWVKHAINLTPYIGQTVTVRIEAVTDSSLNSNLFIDDVTFQSTAALSLADKTGASVTDDPINASRLGSGESDYGMPKP